MMGYSTFPKAPTLLEPHQQINLCHIQDIRGKAEGSLVYSITPANWAAVRWALVFYILLLQTLKGKKVQTYLKAVFDGL